jgi:HTH-type transcriptional regulator/antitoxin HigA
MIAGWARMLNTTFYVKRICNTRSEHTDAMYDVKLKYTVIRNDEQYNEYCDIYWSLVTNEAINHLPEVQEESDLLYLLIESYQEQFWPSRDIDPVKFLQLMMEEHKLRSKDLANMLGVSKSLVSSILHYRRGLSKKNIRLLAAHFKMQEEVFSKPYTLKNKG